MKKTKLFTSIAALALVLGLGACELPEETTSEESGVTTETDTTVETDTGNESTTSEETSEGGTTSESTSEGGNTSESTSEGGNEGDEGEEDETYLFGFELDGTLNYIDGGTIEGYSYEGTFTTNVDDAVRVKVESTETAGEYYLSYELNETTYWITIIENNGHTNLSYATEAAPLYWNATYNCWGDNTLSYFLCYYKNTQYNYECLYCSALTYVSSSPIAGLYTEDGVACTEGLVGYELPAPTKITVSGRETLYIGNTTQLSVTVEPANAVADVTWSSSSDAIATVSDTGLVEGIADGTATITATSIKDTSVSGSIDIVVSEAPAGQTEKLLGTLNMDLNTDSTNNPTQDSYTTLANLIGFWEGNSDDFTAVSNVNKTYIGLNSNTNTDAQKVLQIGSSSAPGSITLSFSQNISKVEIYGGSYYNAGIQMRVNNSEYQVLGNGYISSSGIGNSSSWSQYANTITFDLDGTSQDVAIETYTTATSSAPRAVVKTIAVYYYG